MYVVLKVIVNIFFYYVKLIKLKLYVNVWKINKDFIKFI